MSRRDEPRVDEPAPALPGVASVTSSAPALRGGASVGSSAPALRGGASVRTCVGCRQTDERAALLRFVLAGDPPQIVPDLPRRAGGRGVSVHPRRPCLDAAVRNGALRRAFKTELPALNADDLARWAGGQYARRLDGLLHAAYRSGHAVIGTERVRDAIASRRAALLVVAGDASEQRQDMMATAE